MPNTQFRYVVTKQKATFWFPDGAKFVVNGRDATFDKCVRAAELNRQTQLRKWLDASTAAADPDFEFLPGGVVKFEGKELHKVLAKKLEQVFEQGNIEPWRLFVRKLYQNPLASSIEDLFAWLEKSDLPITPDGDFLAYKRVRNDFKDHYTGTMDNSVGKIVSMPRERVDPNRYNECSSGLHFCSKSYLGGFHAGGGPVMVVKINPADVVAIPTDYDRAKGRAWKYTVVGKLNETIVDKLKWDAVETMPPPAKLEKKKKSSSVDVISAPAPSKKTVEIDSSNAEEMNERRFDTPIGWVSASQMLVDLEEMDGSVAALAKYYQIPRGTLWSRLQTVK